MTVREFLQIELWSKNTTRKIVKVVGVCFGSLVVVGAVFLALELGWINPHERSTAKIALADIEGLRQISAESEDEYKTRKVKAEVAAESALEAAWTWRDERICTAISAYLTLVEMQHEEPQRRAMLHDFYQKHPQFKESDTQEADALSKQVIHMVGTNLHRVLE